jgi:FlaA1/EpsC-like NDP-sugar epimerase
MSTPNIKFVSQFCADMVSIHKLAKIALMVAADLIALPACFLVAMLLRLGDLHLALAYGPAPFVLVPLATIAAFSMSDLYRAVIRFIDKRLLTVTGIALALSSLCVYTGFLALHGRSFPGSALAIYWFVAFSYVVASRISVRNFLRNHTNARPATDNTVAIYGAGESGAQLALTMRASREYRPVCFFDEKRALNARTIAGLRVFHTDRLSEMVDSLAIRSIIIAVPSVSPARLRSITQRMSEAGITTRILSGLLDLADDQDQAPKLALQTLKLEQLLGRAPVPPRIDLFARCVRGKTVLVTGAGGSIGSELCRQIATLGPARLHLLDHSEFALYTIKQELQARLPELAIEAHLGSVCNCALVDRIMQSDRIDTIYHAAAYKHVPLVEANIVEGLRNNVLGAQCVANAAARYGVTTCVLISSDKAVRPANIMGASKRIAELIFQAAAKQDSATTFCMVRFGNVLGSSGSVIPLFQRQIAHRGPVTITHPEVARYFMLISEAAQLVIQAGAMAKGGDVFVLDMGEPIRIVDLARTMIALSGLSEKTAQHPGGDIEIKFVGLFPGEKLNEELLTDGEAFPSEHTRIKYMREPALLSDILDTYITCLMLACDTNDRPMIESMVKAIVADYTPHCARAAPLAQAHKLPPPAQKIEYRS